jgi:microcystin-dependent protein
MENLKVSEGIDTGIIKNSGIPVGAIITTAGASYASTISNGRCPCDGRSLSTSEYPDLFNVIGYTYGGSGGSFNVPKLMPDIHFGGNNASRPDKTYVSGKGNENLGSFSGSTSHSHTAGGGDFTAYENNPFTDNHYHTVNTRTITPITSAHNHNYTTGAMALGNPPNPTSSKTDGNASAAGAGHLHNSPAEAVIILSQVNTTNSVSHTHDMEVANNSTEFSAANFPVGSGPYAPYAGHTHTYTATPMTHNEETTLLSYVRVLYYIKL